MINWEQTWAISLPVRGFWYNF